nr:MAG TPA_asm: hypothetical protein [Caudoviricetes sp.]
MVPSTPCWSGPPARHFSWSLVDTLYDRAITLM